MCHCHCHCHCLCTAELKVARPDKVAAERLLRTKVCFFFIAGICGQADCKYAHGPGSQSTRRISSVVDESRPTLFGSDRTCRVLDAGSRRGVESPDACIGNNTIGFLRERVDDIKPAHSSSLSYNSTGSYLLTSCHIGTKKICALQHTVGNRQNGPKIVFLHVAFFFAQNRKLRQSARQIVILVRRETHEQPAPQRNASASQHISTSAQPTTNNKHSNKQQHRHQHNNNHQQPTTNTQSQAQQQHQQLFHQGASPERTLSRIDARACAQKKSQSAATTAET